MPRIPAVIFDRDGTLASVDWCRPTPGDNDSWAFFNAMLPFDSPVPIVAGLLNSIRPGVHRFMFSGRMAGNRAGDTHRYWQLRAWLDKHDLPIDTLLMREGGDQRRDSIVKAEMLDSILPFYDVRFVVDDRPQVCDMWRARGIPLLQVTDPCIPPALFTENV